MNEVHSPIHKDSLAGAAGLTWDGGGDDKYICNHGDLTAVESFVPQCSIAQQRELKLCQGAGFGRVRKLVSQRIHVGWVDS